MTLASYQHVLVHKLFPILLLFYCRFAVSSGRAIQVSHVPVGWGAARQEARCNLGRVSVPVVTHCTRLQNGHGVMLVRSVATGVTDTARKYHRCHPCNPQRCLYVSQIPSLSYRHAQHKRSTGSNTPCAAPSSSVHAFAHASYVGIDN